MAALLSRPVWGAWIEIILACNKTVTTKSRPVWGAWIEIEGARLPVHRREVAPRMGRVD